MKSQSPDLVYKSLNTSIIKWDAGTKCGCGRRMAAFASSIPLYCIDQSSSVNVVKLRMDLVAPSLLSDHTCLLNQFKVRSTFYFSFCLHLPS